MELTSGLAFSQAISGVRLRTFALKVRVVVQLASVPITNALALQMTNPLQGGLHYGLLKAAPSDRPRLDPPKAPKFEASGWLID